ncbi:MAG: hypothetical protein COB85_02620 [Bacteroidetes bacterium]|nr:MAG: hypothetical protein COB85_02620 [Bacteroidota bacterium]
MMNKTVFILLFSLIATAGFGQSTAPSFKFEKKVLKLPKTKVGEILNISYPFTNEGTTPLIISDIKVACSCTKPSWPAYPILPGNTDTIHVSINTKTLIGWQDRILEIHSNSSDSPDKIRFKLMVDNSENKKK